MAGNDIAIQVKNVSKSYRLFKDESDHLKYLFFKKKPLDIKHALSDVSFSIERGESVALFGRNGAGKSTILKLITGVAFPTEGTVRVNGRVSALLELRAGFSNEMTGRENIYFRGEIMGISKDEMRKIEKKIVDFAELGDYIDQPVKSYSSGMKSRLGFAINANIDPDILIVDEALSAGDKSFRLKCRKKVDEIISGNVTFLFVTHSTSEAKSFCKRGIVLRHGRVVFDGDIDAAAEYYEKMIKVFPGR